VAVKGRGRGRGRAKEGEAEKGRERVERRKGGEEGGGKEREREREKEGEKRKRERHRKTERARVQRRSTSTSFLFASTSMGTSRRSFAAKICCNSCFACVCTHACMLEFMCVHVRVREGVCSCVCSCLSVFSQYSLSLLAKYPNTHTCAATGDRRRHAGRQAIPRRIDRDQRCQP
jgi:hypothetical protein